MKSVATAAVLFGALFAVPAVAADIPVKAAPLAAVAYSWTGFYIGGHAGYAWGNTTATDTVATNGACWTICGRHWTTKHDGFVGGGQVGYNWQVGQAVLGIEADFGTLGGRHSAIYPVTPTTTLDVRGGFYSTVRGRVGGLVRDNLLAYGTAGWIGANLRPTVNQPVPTIIHTEDTKFVPGSRSVAVRICLHARLELQGGGTLLQVPRQADWRLDLRWHRHPVFQGQGRRRHGPGWPELSLRGAALRTLTTPETA